MLEMRKRRIQEKRQREAGSPGSGRPPNRRGPKPNMRMKAKEDEL